MKRQITTLLLSTLVMLVMTVTANAQTVLNSADNYVVYPFGTAFNPAGKFAAIGESGGTVGPTANGCDLYGFRSQLSATQSINIGMQDYFGRRLPIVSFESVYPYFIQEQNATGTGTGGNLNCGKVLAAYKDRTNGFVYTIYGSATASGGIWQPSDRTLKKDVKPITSAMDMVMQLEGVTYFYRADERPELNLPTIRNYGFITQDVQKVLPEAVADAFNDDGTVADYDVMQYTAIIPVLTEAIKEQQGVITDLEDRLAEQLEINNNLEDRLERIEKLLGNQLETPSIGADKVSTPNTGIKLEQNRPNPTNGFTSIDYAIDANMDNAKLIVYNINGVQVMDYNLQAGGGTVEVDTNRLSSGTYVYTITVDGKNLARQKMVVK